MRLAVDMGLIILVYDNLLWNKLLTSNYNRKRANIYRFICDLNKSRLSILWMIPGLCCGGIQLFQHLETMAEEVIL